MQKLVISVLIICSFIVASVSATPLDDYVNTPDPHYKYELLKTYEQVGYKLHILNLTSQKWQNESIVANPIWWHYLCITIPDKLEITDAAVIWIDGGKNTDGIPTPNQEFIEILSTVSIASGVVTAALFQIPNQPTLFFKDPLKKQRTEDAVIAWTWKEFLENPDDPMILLRLPMTKAAVRAMDAVTDFVQKTVSASIKKFMVAGASKRGWTTWTTAAVDKRVFAAVPVVMDMLSLNTNLHVHYRSLGGWTFAFFDYFDLNITTHVDSNAMFAMERVIDPKTYLDRYKDIKLLVITTAGDEFFLAEDTHAYWEDLVAATGGSVLLRRLPNAEHSCIGHKVSLMFSLRSFFLTVYQNKPLPKVRWSRPNNSSHGIIEATVDIVDGLVPSDVKVYYAKTLDDNRKDFRLVVGGRIDPRKAVAHPVIWEKTTKFLSTNATETKINYKAAFIRPISGYFAFFIQFSFLSVDNTVIQVTTETNVIPETFPFEDCTLEGCFGKLV